MLHFHFKLTKNLTRESVKFIILLLSVPLVPYLLINNQKVYVYKNKNNKKHMNEYHML